MYLIDREKEFSEAALGQILQKFQTNEKPKIEKWFNYYDGNQAIMQKVSKDENKKYNRVVTNYAYSIVQNYLGYLTGIPIQYENDNFDEIIDILKWNDYINEDSELLKQALITGRAFEINYVDREGQQRFRMLDSRTCIPVYDNTLNQELQYVIRFWEEELDADNQPVYLVEVYGPNTIKKYKSWQGFSSFTLLEEQQHFYGQCPVTVFSLNNEEKSIFAQIISLQDAYNEVVSGSIDDFDAFADAYLLLKGLTAEEEDLAKMKENRILMMDSDCGAEYLTKEINDNQTLNIITRLNDNIHKLANCPDFNDERFFAQSGVAIRYKLVGFENAASAIESQMRKALQRRLELISTILSLTDSEKLWREASITFTRNLPTDLADTVTVITQLRGLVSDRTLLTQVPFVTDIDEELKAIEEEKQANMQLYSKEYEDLEDE